MQSTAATVDEYLKTVPADRLAALVRIRQLCLDRLKGYEESMAYGGPTYSKNGVIEVGFASQKHFIGLYIKKDVVDKYREQLKDVGVYCIRYRKPEQIDFELVDKLIEGTAESSAEICP
jgi:uncharacterized protein YdhG (YjbR/CyaY superfamily)